MHSEKRIFKLL